MKFAEFLEKRLDEMDLSLAEFATRVTLRGYSVSKSAVAQWKLGLRQPKLLQTDCRNAIASALQIDVNDMMRTLGLIVHDDERSARALYGAEIIDSLDDDTQQTAIDLLIALAKRK